jgi:hypothetical protein
MAHFVIMTYLIKKEENYSWYKHQKVKTRTNQPNRYFIEERHEYYKDVGRWAIPETEGIVVQYDTEVPRFKWLLPKLN